MAMAQTAYQTRTAFRYATVSAAKRSRRAKTPLLQAFLRPSCLKTINGFCIKDATTIDPACGTSGFLVTVSDYLKENRKQEVFFDSQNKGHYMNHMFHGYDTDRTMLRIGAMNMMTHGVDNLWWSPCQGPKRGKKRLGQDSRSQALFIHAARGCPSR